MSAHENGGPAFPVPGLSNLPNGDFIYPEAGMTLRDYFAAHAIPALIANSALNPRAFSCADALKMCASSAYAIADAMLKERAK